ncbi:MAG: hypothetical protein M1833_005507 [Piccolia ochrophora]|nr:MAG: hypothetical protein M1833_005507 [Piccolia ochrophora]
MSVSLSSNPWPAHSSTQERTNSMGLFGSMRQKLSRKGSAGSKTSSKSTLSKPPSPQQSWSRSAMNPPSTTSNPFSSPPPSQPTRRPRQAAGPASSSADLPPAYSPPTPNTNTTTAHITHAADSRFAFLATFDTVFLIDDSGSMAGASWRKTASALASIAPICTAHDADGIDIHFLNAPDLPSYKHLTSAAAVAAVFGSVRPTGGTPTGTRLNHLLSPYLARYAKHPTTTKPLNVIVVTDGEASDDVESVIIRAARKLDKLDAEPWQVGVQFFQVGDAPEAAEALRDLDDGLAGVAAVRDIVDTVPYKDGMGIEGERILKCVLGAVNRRLDRKRHSEEVERK